MQIFLGYAREDLEHAKDVAACLKGAGYSVWRDGDLLVGGDNWDAERLAGQKAADFIIHLLSPVIERRRSVAMREIRETLRLLEDEPFSSNLAMFMRLEEYRVPVQLTVWHYVDKFKDGWQSDLLRAVEKRVAQLEGRKPQNPTQSIATEAPTVEAAEAPVTSKNVELMEGTEGFTSRASYPQYPGKTPFWELVNASIASRALAQHVGWRTQAEQLLEYRPDQLDPQELWQEVAVTEFYRDDDLLSIRIYIHDYSGGAHPNHGVESLNFFGNAGGLVGIRELLNWDDETAKWLAGLCFDRLVAAYGTDDDGSTFSLTTREEMETNAWQGLDRFTFDRRTVTFSFPPYEVMPYACGIIECSFFWHEIITKIPDRYRTVVDRIRNG
ncbi:TIR domain-containing protein [Bosea sp. CCNWLW174]|uniref:TIR domain-containing protein n=1 Tax=unclassified Bosea (in: a-proteobacteria) TaxID=2653178 RepID=UPI0030152598